MVEDEPLIAMDIASTLTESGFSVEEVHTAAAALETLQAMGFAALVTDVRLGSDVEGWDIARKAREILPSIAVVYMSGDSAHEHSARGVPRSVMLQKPFANVQVVVALATLLNADPPASPSFGQ